MPTPTLILITGYARSGKDTLAEGIMTGISPKSGWALKHNFADALKQSANDYLKSLGLDEDGVDFYDEAFKVKHRSFLVAAGQFARSINRDVFASRFVSKCLDFTTSHGPGVVVCSDWRYMNELRVCQDWLIRAGWNVVTVEITTAGVGPANEEEGLSIGEIRRQHSPSLSLMFQPDRAQLIKAEGRNLARQIGL
jgi:hypothetical protein